MYVFANLIIDLKYFFKAIHLQDIPVMDIIVLMLMNVNLTMVDVVKCP